MVLSLIGFWKNLFSTYLLAIRSKIAPPSPHKETRIGDLQKIVGGLETERVIRANCDRYTLNANRSPMLKTIHIYVKNTSIRLYDTKAKI